MPFTTAFLLPLLALTHAHNLPRQKESPICTSYITYPPITITNVAPVATFTPGFHIPPFSDGQHGHNGHNGHNGHGGSGMASASREAGKSRGGQTIYETVYSTICPVCEGGLGPATYTITQDCPEMPGSPCRPTGSKLPPGFTTSVVECEVCEEDSKTVTLTVPCPEKTAVYEAVYPQFCSTGLEPKTYTITHKCREEVCTPRPGKCPPGFTTTVSVCSTCGTSPITATLTVPISGNPAQTAVVPTKERQRLPMQTAASPAITGMNPKPQPVSENSELACPECSTTPTMKTVIAAAAATVPVAGSVCLVIAYMILASFL